MSRYFLAVFASAGLFGNVLVKGMQLDLDIAGNLKAGSKTNPSIPFYRLHKKQVKERGSWCLDGSYPGYYYEPAGKKSDTKWILNLQAGGWCKDVKECVERTSSKLMVKSLSSKELSVTQIKDFQDYHHVIFWYCDGGLFSGDKTDPVTVPDPENPGKEKTLFFRGRRILDHIIDTLKMERNFKHATEVMLTGGSAGGLATYMVADYVRAQMPESVYKFRAVPQSGWWSSIGAPEGYGGNRKEFKDFYWMHNMSTVSENCLEATGKEDQWKCIFSDFSYTTSDVPFFPVQVYDMFIAAQNQTTKKLADTDYSCIVNSMQEGQCTGESIDRINTHLYGIVEQFMQTNKSRRNGEGGFISSCNLHSFYKYDEFFHYSNGESTMANAVMEWWHRPTNDTASRWYLPCRFHRDYPHQCEQSCSFVGADTVQHTEH